MDSQNSQRLLTLTENEISKIIVECALNVHRNLWPGLLECSYEECLFYELKKKELFVENKKPFH